ncbi:hypothetical protein C0J52_05213 [Blattella germanica]|nr:hypothetical protein C0J52_05213 [Blattella germanica]
MRKDIYLLFGLLAMVLANRRPRNLVYPEGSFIQFIFGFGIPISVYDQSMTLGTIMKFLYDMPYNATVFTDAIPPVQKRATPPVTRLGLYSALETSADRLGLDGRACVLRTICEAADTTLQHSGLLGEVLHVLLSPSTTSDMLGVGAEREYHAAERLGRKVPGSCPQLYPECSMGLLDLISTTENRLPE